MFTKKELAVNWYVNLLYISETLMDDRDCCFEHMWKLKNQSVQQRPSQFEIWVLAANIAHYNDTDKDVDINTWFNCKVLENWYLVFGFYCFCCCRSFIWYVIEERGWITNISVQKSCWYWFILRKIIGMLRPLSLFIAYFSQPENFIILTIVLLCNRFNR